MENSILVSKNSPFYLSLTKQFLKDKIEYLCYVLIFILIFFQLFPFAGGITYGLVYIPFIVLTIFLTLQLFNYIEFNFDKTLIFIYLMFSAWLLLGIIHLYFHSQHTSAIFIIRFRLAHLVTFYIVTQFLTSYKRIRIFDWIIITCIVWNIGIVIWEITTLTHLPTSRLFKVSTYIPTGAFFNENTLPAVTMLCVPILIFMNGKISSIIASTVFFTFYLLTFVHMTRSVLLALFPFVIYHFIFKTNRLYKIIAIMVLISAFFMFKHTQPELYDYSKSEIQRRFNTLGDEIESQRTGSGELRLRMIKMGFELCVESRGLGVGTGNFRNSITPEKQSRLGGIEVTHSFFSEILAMEGLPGILILSIIVFYPLIPLFCDKKLSIISYLNINNMNKKQKKILMFIFLFFISTFVPGSIQVLYLYWSMLGYHYAILISSNEETMS